jgi:hypothetical protein
VLAGFISHPGSRPGRDPRWNYLRRICRLGLVATMAVNHAMSSPSAHSSSSMATIGWRVDRHGRDHRTFGVVPAGK